MKVNRDCINKNNEKIKIFIKFYKKYWKIKNNVVYYYCKKQGENFYEDDNEKMISRI